MKKSFLFIALAALLAIAAGTGYFFSKRETLPLYLTKPDQVRIPLRFSISHHPILDAHVCDMHCELELDLGSKSHLTLDKKALSQMEKRKLGAAFWKDAKGNSYESTSYVLPKVVIGDIVLKNVPAEEESEQFLLNSVFWSENHSLEVPQEGAGKGAVGRRLLEGYNLFLNFPHSEVVAFGDKYLPEELLSENDLLGRDIVTVPLKVYPTLGIFLSIETDLGPLWFNLDTGSTVSIVRSPLAEGLFINQDQRGLKTITSSKFRIGNKQFGPTQLYLFDIVAQPPEMGGILGMDFLREYPMVIDYKNSLAYISFIP